jgi:acyl-coenzyme A thioesterase PaaI-like protein
MWTSTGNTGSQAKEGKRASSVVSVFHIGQDLCGHPGFVHGGLLSVLFDEVFARCVSAAFPSGLGMTANLNVDFRKPALPDRMYVLRTETVKVEGRKAWVEGRMTYLPLSLPLCSMESGAIVPDAGLLREDSEGAVMVAEAKALFIEPKFADVSFSFSYLYVKCFSNDCS